MSQFAFEIRYSQDALRSLRLSNKRELIRKKIEEFALNPDVRTANVKRLVGREEYRLRVQDWRVIFRLEDGIVFVDRVGPRGSVYEVN
jgi:mRNA interferase RelE/StbE